MTGTQTTQEKWVCEDCGETTFEYLSAPNPFWAEDTIVGCPHCKSVNSLTQACQHDGCLRHPDRGYVDKLSAEYVFYCHEHIPLEEREALKGEQQ